jgi:predicted nucleic acid-binding protein
MKPMHDNVFVDSNIWLYSLIQPGDVNKHQQSLNFLLQLSRPVINSQVIREICSNLKKKTSLPEDQLCTLIDGWYQDCNVVHSNAAQHLLASRLRKSFSFSYWDSLIVAAAINSNCVILYSEDMQHGLVIDGKLTILNPFL